MLAIESRNNAKSAIQAENWEEALELLIKALKLDPTDEGAKKLRDGLQGLLKAEALLNPFAIQLDDRERKNKVQAIAVILRESEDIKDLVNAQRYKVLLARHSLYKAETELPESWMLKVLAPHNNIKKAQQIAQKILNEDDPALIFTKTQLGNTRPLRIGIFSLIFMAVIFTTLTLFWRPISTAFVLDPTPILRSTHTVTLTPTSTQSPTFTLTITPTDTLTLTPTLQPTETWTPVLSPTPAFTLGYVNVSGVSPVDTIDIPNGRVVARLPRNQIVKILERETAFTIDYYLCEWKIDGVIGQGWIPVEYIKFVSPTLSPTP